MDKPIDQICPYCKGLDPSAFPDQPEEGKRKYASVELDWKQISNNIYDCTGCALLVDVICAFSIDRKSQPRGSRGLDRVSQRKESLEAIKLDSISMEFHHTIRLRFDRGEHLLYCIRPTPWRSISVQNHLSGWTGSEDSLKWAKDAIERCAREHEACRVPQHTPLPTRVLDLEEQNDPQGKGKIRLVETGYATAPYAALSHCWGKAHRILTTKDTIDSHKEGIEIGSLPTTFRDAVDFTRRLGIRYLWIDSLCIIQGDEEDWKREAAKMSEVYQNSFVCLAATNADNDNGGCYSCDPIRVEQIKAEAPGTFTAPWTVYARQHLDHMAISDPMFGQRTDVSGILRTRAWVYQERMLAPRFLHFLEQELLLECHTTIWCECGCTHGAWVMGAMKLSVAEALASGDAKRIAFQWRQMVTTYSRLKLTVLSDRLPAIAGTAKQFKQVRGVKCNAGVWSGDTALEDLCWETHNPGGIRTDERIQGTPTWSWGSVAAPVFYDYDYGFDASACFCQILHIDNCGMMLSSSEVAGPRPYKIIIEGYMLPATLLYQHSGTFCKLEVFKGEKSEDLGNDVALGIPGPSYVPNDETVYCIQMIKTAWGQYKSLVLRKVGGEEGMYERIGVMRNKDVNLFSDVSQKTRVTVI